MIIFNFILGGVTVLVIFLLCDVDRIDKELSVLENRIKELENKLK